MLHFQGIPPLGDYCNLRNNDGLAVAELTLYAYILYIPYVTAENVSNWDTIGAICTKMNNSRIYKKFNVFIVLNAKVFKNKTYKYTTSQFLKINIPLGTVSSTK